MKRLLITLLLTLFALPAVALESAPATTGRDTVTLVSDTDAVAPGTSFRVALRFRLAEGWHTYWKNPGDAGVPPDLTLDLPAGAKAGPIDWPAPRRIAEGSVMTYAYTGEVLLPVTVTPPARGGPVTLTAHAQWLVCKDICVPEQGEFHLALPAGTASPSAQAPLFAEHDRTVPRPSPWAATVSDDGALWVRGPELSTATVVDAWFIPDQPDRIQDIAPQLLSVQSDGFVLSLKPAKGTSLDTGVSGILSILDRSGQQTNVTVTAPPGPAPSTSTMPLTRVLAFAFVGGLILNLMPCVFPILAIKAVGFAAGVARGKAQAHAVSYTLGVLVTFVGLASALLAARAAGTAAGWGFQFASPVFVAAMAWLLFGVGLNLSGVFQLGASLAGVGGRLTDRHGHLGSFFTGLLAVLVATPCTAPFMSVAVAAGLAAAPPVTMLVFVMMGLGLAAPYIALSCLPGLARRIPRPGRWMELLKQGLAFPMYGASVWLLWVVSQEAGPAGVLATATGFVLLGFAAWVLGISQTATGRNRRFGHSAATACVLAALAVLSGIAVTQAEPPAQTASNIVAFSTARLNALRAEGRPVFVDMTAAWCVTCLVNERVAIDTTSVQQEFIARHVAYLQGDWTRQAPDITAYLRQNGHDGVPLYVYYPPHGGLPRILPQILTEDTVLAELARG
jgi:thiol:disulfide interchange protein DsbD